MNIHIVPPKEALPKEVVKVSITDSSIPERFIVHHDGRQILEISRDKKKPFTVRKLHIVLRKIIASAKKNHIQKIAVSLSDFPAKRLGISPALFSEILTVNFFMANFQFLQYKTHSQEEQKNEIQDAYLIAPKTVGIQRGVERGKIIGNEVNKCRILANIPGGDMTPDRLAQAAVRALSGIKKTRVVILDEKEIKKEKMGGVLGVAQGSREAPRFIILEYHGNRKQKPIVLIGKGVTFDTGGLNIKTGEHMLEMNMDMSGGAAVIHTISCAARLGLKKNIVGLIPAVENMPSGSSFRPGDILTSLSGKTIEVLNTDAEGRIILADALTYAKRYQPRLVVDIATLTGAAIVALGQRTSALFSNHPGLLKRIQAWGEVSGDDVWPLPLWDEYEEEIQGTFGDIANIGKTRWGGAITAAIFLYQFAKDLPCPWAHIDIAPRMTSIEGEYLAKGSVGAPVRLLLKLIESM